MERHETMMRAARYLLGAGTFAAAMVAMTASASAQTSACLTAAEGGDHIVCGHVFIDENSDEKYTPGEGAAGTGVILKDGLNQVVSNPNASGGCEDPDYCGYYGFAFVPTGDYWVCLGDLDTFTCTGTPVKVTVVQGTQTKPVDFMIGSTGGPEIPLDQEPPYQISGPGTGTPGYWKNHRYAWPVEGVKVGGVQYYNTQPPPPAGAKTILDAIKLMGKVSGDKSYTMFASLISAKLSAWLGNNSLCIQGTLAAADTWMITNYVGSAVKGSSPAWEAGEPLHSKLDDYNNGKLCAPHRN